jgi:prepilin-type N-terminal cleavage/methylation domain-containing protein
MQKQKTSGFTIVELLIVIVVIGILAAITIVAFNGVQERARASAVSSALTQASNKLAVYQVDNPNIYPADKTAIEALGIKDTDTVSYQYTRTSGTPDTYCLTATTGLTSYKIGSTSPTPTKGGCAGHGQGGAVAITNLALNPSFEAASGTVNGQPGLAGIGGHPTNGSYAYQTNTWGQAGSNSLQITASTNGSVDTFAQIPNGWFTPAMQPNAKVSVAAYIRLTQAGSATQDGRSRRIYVYLNTTAGNAVLQTTAAPNSVGTHLVRGVFTVPSDYTSISFARLYNGHSDVNIQWDALTIVAGDYPNLTPQDGNSTDWMWNGTANNSTSTGPQA